MSKANFFHKIIQRHVSNSEIELTEESKKEGDYSYIESESPLNSNATIIYEFKIDGMTCVACSQTIEGAMKKEFSSKGLINC
jgi:hypothetical protein